MKYINIKYIDQNIFEESQTHSKLILDGIDVISQFDNVYRVDEDIGKWIVTGASEVNSRTNKMVDNIADFIKSFKWKLILGISGFVVVYLLIMSIIFYYRSASCCIFGFCKKLKIKICPKLAKNRAQQNEFEMRNNNQINVSTNRNTAKSSTLDNTHYNLFLHDSISINEQ